MKKYYFVVLLFFVSVSYLFPQSVNKNVMLGVPKDSDSTDDFLSYKKQFVVSFNPKKRVPNWVSWELNSSWYDTVSRVDRFIPDPDLPEDIKQATNKDYLKSNYDRGHVVRSEERTRTAEDNQVTFYFSNMLPQREDLNRGLWLNFEYFCETLAVKQNKQLFVVAGGIFNKTYKKIGSGVAVPKFCFKIVVVLNSGESIADVNENTAVIAVIMPNINGVRKHKWRSYVTNVNEIEGLTGYDFLNGLSEELQEVLESKVYSDS